MKYWLKSDIMDKILEINPQGVSMKPYTVSLFGHRDFYGHRQVEERLIPILRDMIRRHEFIEIYIGRDGEFDTYAATIVKRVQREYDDYHAIEFNLVLPYPKKDMDAFEKYYDRVNIPISAHPKLAITKRNEWMAEQSDLILCYIERESGGAYRAVQYAKKLGKEVINLAEKNKEDEME